MVSTSRPAFTQPLNSQANANQPSQILSTQANHTGASKCNPTACSKKATQSQAKEPTQPRFAALPSLQAELKRAIDTNAKTTKAKAANAAKAAKTATTKALALAEGAKAAEAAATAQEASARGQPGLQSTTNITSWPSRSQALTTLQLTADIPPTSSCNSASNATNAPNLNLYLGLSGLQSGPASPKGTSQTIEDSTIDHSDRPCGHNMDNECDEDNGQHHEDNDWSDVDNGQHHHDQWYEDDGSDADNGQHHNPQAEISSGHEAQDDYSMDNIKCDVVCLLNGNTRKRLKSKMVQRLEGMDLDKLRQRCYKQEHYSCLVTKDKADLDEATKEYDKQILRIVCWYKLNLETVEAYLGQGHRA
ncbi:hypothetical protein Pst134EA_005018 [Puccinia striiformis f. sp. tritici]|uniref:Uncharacterized protein n=1 Tax=Puccinia striiformis f. sp. tritici PST-78 TaxID=1165861 RepID=A0A0L0V1G8_9BASI|nr:hypothetical protein Pst134EA_005018 [Puccinia striiformis f. sp. tritici]KAH9471110.1 hypothetical protein Pst134EA_005018 [Puccinia striiformis f. sp. tritici]KAI9621789.1 hypothetical protein H4Q26_015555 [Puccinia striiformis f. sp. tritici PST-130]KNE93152.1 hypothetical protein PSTG_13470 [Puccinia striiformis f. sp. tritici PST-78]